MKKKLANVNVKKKPYLVDFASENAQYAQLIRYITNNGKKKKNNLYRSKYSNNQLEKVDKLCYDLMNYRKKYLKNATVFRLCQTFLEDLQQLSMIQRRSMI